MLWCDSWRRTADNCWRCHCQRATTANPRLSWPSTTTADSRLRWPTGLTVRQRSCCCRQRLARLHGCRWWGSWRWHYSCSMMRWRRNAHHGHLVRWPHSRTWLGCRWSTVPAKRCWCPNALHINIHATVGHRSPVDHALFIADSLLAQSLL